jgi:Protein of unknown function (DUF1360)
VATVAERVEERAFGGYAPPSQRPPMIQYAVLTSVFGAGLAAFIAASREGKIAELPGEVATKDVVLTGIATHKLSRMIGKDRVTSFLRAPFRRYKEQTGPNEMSEATRGEGWRAAIGELVGCPYCIGLWVAAGLSAGVVVAPRETRFVNGILTALTASDFLQIAYKAAEDKGLG